MRSDSPRNVMRRGQVHHHRVDRIIALQALVWSLDRSLIIGLLLQPTSLQHTVCCDWWLTGKVGGRPEAEEVLPVSFTRLLAKPASHLCLQFYHHKHFFADFSVEQSQHVRGAVQSLNKIRVEGARHEEVIRAQMM